MTVCIDTNVVLQMRAPRSPLFRLLIAWTHGYFSWAVSAEIWLEYEEIVCPDDGHSISMRADQAEIC